MRKALFVLFIITMICSCTTSIQEKAEDFAEKTVETYFEEIRNYEPVDTHVDSLFWNVSFDMEVRKQTRRLIKLKADYTPILQAYNSAAEKLGTKTELNTKNQLQELKLRKTELEEEMETCKTIIRDKYNQAEKSYFYGWSLLHHFYITDQSGRKRQTWAILLTDKKVENIIYDEVIFEDSSIQTEVCNTILEVLNKETLLK